MDANKTAGEETRWQLHKNAACNPQQVLAATPNKTPTVLATCPLSRKLFKLDEPKMQGHCWRSRDELIRDVLLWIPTHGRAKAGRPARTYIQQLCEDTGCCPEDLPRAMNDREEWRKRVRDIRAASTIWWWWWFIVYFSSNTGLSPSVHLMSFVDSIPIQFIWIESINGYLFWIDRDCDNAGNQFVWVTGNEQFLLFCFKVAGILKRNNKWPWTLSTK